MIFDYKRPWLYDKQLQAIFDIVDFRGESARYGLVEASTKAGKTTACLIWLFEQAYIGGEPGRNYWWVAPVFKQAEMAFERMKLALPKTLYDANNSDKVITLLSGAKIWFKSAEKPDNLYGDDVYAAVMDEASRCREESFHAVRSTLTATRGPFRAIGNVKGRKNWFFAMCRQAEAGAPNMAYSKLTAVDAVAAGVLEQEEIDDARNRLPDHVFKELYLAEPSADGGNPFGLAAIRAAVRPLSTKPPAAWGWDVAKSIDWTVGVGLDADGATCRLERWQHVPWPETIERMKKLTGRSPALVDSTGVGDPVLELVQQELGSNFEGYKFTSLSKQSLMEGLAVAIQSRTIGFPMEPHHSSPADVGPIVFELELFEYEYTRTGVRYSAPEGYHDDVVCALALANKCRGERRGLEVWSRL